MSTRKNAAYNIAYRVFSLLLPIITAPYLARTVGQEGTGLYAYAWSVSAVFVLLGMLGLENYGVRAVARVKDDQQQLDRTFSEIYQMQWLTAGAALVLYVGYVCFVAGAEKQIAAWLTLMSVSCLVNLDWLLMGLDQFKPIALRNTFVKLMAMAGVFLLVRGPGDLWKYGLIWGGSTVVGCLSCWSSVRGRVCFHRVPWRDALKHLPPCAVLFLSVIAVQVYRTMDKIMVGAISGMAQNGLYENAEKIVYCLSGFISAVGTVMLPKVAAMQARGETEAVRKHIALSMELILCMTSAMAFGLAAVAREFAPLFFGEDFAESGTLMIPLGFTLIFIGFANVVRTQWVLPQGRDKIFVRSVTAGAVVNLIVNSVMIPRMGAMGAVVGTLMAEFTVPFAQWVMLRRELPYKRFLGMVGSYAVIGLAMVGAVRLLGRALPGAGWLHLAAEVCAGAAVYGAGCLLYWKLAGRKDMLRALRLQRKSA